MTALTILGGGNGGQTLAADAALKGNYETVTLFEHPDFAESSLGEAVHTGELTLTGEQANYAGIRRTGTVELDVVTTSIEAAVSGAELVVIVAPAVAHQPLFDLMIPHLEDGQTVCVLPDNFGSLRLRRELSRRSVEADVLVGGFDTLGYGTRMVEPGTVDCIVRASQLQYDALPSSDADDFLEAVSDLPILDARPSVRRLDTTLAVGMANFNPVIHVPAAVLNAGAMEVAEMPSEALLPDESWSLYKHGMSPAIASVQREFYSELVAVADEIGIDLPALPEEAFLEKHSIARQSYDAPFYYQSSITSIAGPDSVTHRYFTEDVPFGAVVAKNLATRFGVETPIINSLITLASCLCGRDFESEGLTLEEVGFAGRTTDEIVDVLREG